MYKHEYDVIELATVAALLLSRSHIGDPRMLEDRAAALVAAMALFTEAEALLSTEV